MSSFCDVTFQTPSTNLNYLNTLERIQYHAALADTGTRKGTNLSKFYEELGLESFSYFNSTPYLDDPIPLARTHLFGTRSVNVLNEIRCKSKSYSNSSYPDSIRCWNKVGTELRNSLILKSF